MTGTRVLIVEDEVIVANNLHDRLKNLQYDVLGIAFSGLEALEQIAETGPDLVLMDINLQGEMDGVETAQAVRDRFDIPVVYLTALASDTILQKAKVTEPYGYILKPFDIRELHSTIEVALYKHAMEKKLRESEKNHRILIEQSLQGIVVVQNAPPWLVLANPPCAEMTGYTIAELLSLSPQGIEALVHKEDRALALPQLNQLLTGELQAASGELRIIRRDGTVRWVEYHASLIEQSGRPAAQAALIDITERKQAAEILQEAHDQLEARVVERTAELAAANMRLQEEIAERRQAEEAVQQRNRELALLNRVIAASATGQEIDRLLETTCRELALAFDTQHAAAGLLNVAKSEMTACMLHRDPSGAGQISIQSKRIPVTGCRASQQLLAHSQPLVIDDGQIDPGLGPLHEELHQAGIASFLAVPFIVEGEVVGSLSAGSTEPNFFSSAEVDLAQRVAEQVSSALAHASLTETQRRLSTALDQAADAVVITDREQTILYVNPAFEGVTGYSRAEVIGQNRTLYESGSSEKELYQSVREAIAVGRVWQGRLIHRRKDGRLIPTDTTITPLRNPAGEIVNYVGTMRDVTREIELEEQFRQAQKMDALGRLAGGIVHDFNNLLTVINMSSGFMQKQIRPQDPLWQNVRHIQETSERATRLIDQLMDFSRREIAEPELLDLGQVVADMSRMLERLIGRDIRLVTSTDGDLCPVRANHSQLEQVLLNLTVNARDAMPDGGTLTIETAREILDEATAARHLDAQAGQHVRLSVIDTGMGMTEKVKARIFEPFFTTKKPGDGTGLGLATVFGIVKQSGGHIRVHSEVGQGTRFDIYLPCMGEL